MNYNDDAGCPAYLMGDVSIRKMCVESVNIKKGDTKTTVLVKTISGQWWEFGLEETKYIRSDFGLIVEGDV